MHALRRAIGISFLAALAGSCSDSSSPTPPCVVDSNVSIAVGDGFTPTFTWTPSCAVGSVIVEQLNTGFGPQIVWGASDPANQIRSGVTFAFDRPGETSPLQQGGVYKVSLGLVVADAVTEVGSMSFNR